MTEQDMMAGLFRYKATIIDVYDGDTVTASIDVGFGLKFRVHLRLYGINTPEMKGKDKAKGVLARDALREMVLNKEVFIETVKDRTEKYGRYLGTLFFTEDGGKNYANANGRMLHLGHAVPYMVGE